MDTKIVFCFHTFDHEINFGIGCISSFLKQNNIGTDLVVYIEKSGHSDKPADIAAEILTKQPSIAAFSVMTFNWHKIREVITLLRKDFNGLIVVGGYHAILDPGDVMSHPAVDAVCIGEGEQPLLELSRFAAAASPGVYPSIDGMIFRGQELSKEALSKRWLAEKLEDYPYIDFAIFNADGNLKQKHLGVLQPGGIFSLPVISGRGCPYRCTYCSNSALLDFYKGPSRFVRRYSPERVISDLKALSQTYQPQYYEFLDETFTLSKEWVLKFCPVYSREIGLPYIVMSRIDLIDEPTVAALAESGLKLFLFGIENGDEEYRVKYLKRNMSNSTIVKGMKLLKKYGLMTMTFNMFGLPYETKETVAKTIALNEEIQPDAALPFIYQPLPGTELAQLAYDNNIVQHPRDDRWDFCAPSLDTPDLPAQYVLETANKFREDFATHNIAKIYARLRSFIRSE
ncbi:MAG: hypothetical protein C0402_06350 [Thermodesulfovibrio sp.]|nr:hypothetical protein [Thermodesulfovibrio sp.]